MTEISSSLIEVLRGYNSGFFVEPFFSSSSTKRAVFAPYSKADCFCDDSSSLWAVYRWFEVLEIGDLRRSLGSWI